MACATLKRSLDWDPLNSSPTSSTGSSKSAPSSAHRPSKRKCFSSYHFSSISPPKQPSPFEDIHPKFTAEDIAMNIRKEMKRLHNRKQLFYSTVTSSSQSSTNCNDLNTLNAFSNLTNSNSNSNNIVDFLSPSHRDQPLFTFKQVGLICEKLIKERELLIREEYERVLATKLAEQYDSFVKFTYDQIQKGFDVGETPSYLS